MTIGVLATVVAIIVAVLIHEFGHFVFAKRFGMKVEEFFFGFGPRLWSTRRGETEYGAKAIPLGGYVRIAGMNPFQKVPEAEVHRTYAGKPPWQRLVVILAGPFTHFVVAFVLLAVWLGMIGAPAERAVAIGGVADRLEGQPSPAAEAGLEPGDEIVAVDGRTVSTVGSLGDYINDRPGEEIRFTVLRDDERLQVGVRPILSDVDGEETARIGVILQPGRVLSTTKEDFLGSLTGSARLVGEGMVGTVRAIPRVFGPDGIQRVGDLVFGEAERRVDDPASLVGIARVAGQVNQTFGLGGLLTLFASINIFIGMINLIPLPPLDGGHIAILAAEKIRGREVDARKLIPVSALVLAFFLMFTFAVLYLDLVKPIDLLP